MCMFLFVWLFAQVWQRWSPCQVRWVFCLKRKRSLKNRRPSSRQRRRRFEGVYWANAHIHAIQRAERLHRRRERDIEQIFQEYPCIVASEVEAQRAQGLPLSWGALCMYKWQTDRCFWRLVVAIPRARRQIASASREQARPAQMSLVGNSW